VQEQSWQNRKQANLHLWMPHCHQNWYETTQSQDVSVHEGAADPMTKAGAAKNKTTLTK
jgi:hypothetical protein